MRVSRPPKVAHVSYGRQGSAELKAFCGAQEQRRLIATPFFSSIQAARSAGFELCPGCLDPNARAVGGARLR
jgi:hypothetical protein